MRNTNAFLSPVLGAIFIVTATAGAVVGGDHFPRSCSSGGVTLTVVAGPCAVSDSANPSCDTPGAFTGIQYQFSGPVDYAATLVTKDNDVSVATGNQVFAPCVGDPFTGLGKYSCHEKTVKVATTASNRFWVVVDGDKQTTLTSVVAKKGRGSIQSFAIVGLGFDKAESAFQTSRRTETTLFKGCAVTFEYDAAGAITNAFRDVAQDNPAPGAVCSPLIVTTVDKLSLTLDGVTSLGAGQFGDGYISSGTNSCTTRVVGGRVYTWGSPCP